MSFCFCFQMCQPRILRGCQHPRASFQSAERFKRLSRTKSSGEGWNHLDCLLSLYDPLISQYCIKFNFVLKQLSASNVSSFYLIKTNSSTTYQNPAIFYFFLPEKNLTCPLNNIFLIAH